MFRYFAFVWDTDSGAELANRHIESLRSSDSAWHCVFESPGIAVLCADARFPNLSRSLADSAGVVLGALFASAEGAPSTTAPERFGSQETAALLTTAGRHLVQHYWGRYVAFLHDAQQRTTHVLRDPTGGLPCFSIDTHSGLHLYCSWIEDVARLGLRFSFDWDCIAALLCSQRLELGYTALEGISQVLGGECITHQGGTRTATFHWNPFEIARTTIEDPGQAVAAVRRATRDCVHAWGSSYERIVHTLSGGLDSAIVLACLSDAPSRPQVTCVNYHSPEGAGDERAFARLAAGHCGAELLERERDVSVSCEPLLHMPRAALPSIYRYYLENSRQEAALAHERGATVLFCGEGGDQLFYQARAAFGAADYLQRHGVLRAMSSDFLRIALDGARIDGVSVWQVFRSALSEAILRRRWNPADEMGRYTELLSAATIAAAKRDRRWLHPHLQANPTAGSGKRWHVHSLSLPAAEYYDPLGIAKGVERVAPLFSQPVLEVCLRIPVDVLTINGWDRAIARRAFQHDLPREIVTRRGKGAPDTYVSDVLRRNIAFVREILLDGHLVRRHIVARSALEAALSRLPRGATIEATEVFDYLNVEAWLQRSTRTGFAS
jgi:asparagine synthase (glutamine-hydrolysing)